MTDDNHDGIAIIPPSEAAPLLPRQHQLIAAPVDYAVAGSLSSMVVFAALYPLDVARTRQQSAGSITPTGIVESISNIYVQEGVKGLYAGISANLISIGTSQCLYFFFYELIKDAAVTLSGNTIRSTSLGLDLLVAFVAGAINATVTCPMWVAATRLKMAKRVRSRQQDVEKDEKDLLEPTFARALVEVVGSGDAWKGLAPSLILCTNPALQYGIYEQLKGRLLRSWAARSPGRTAGVILNPMPAFVIGAIAKAIATVFTYPLQVVQTQTREKGFQGGMWGAFVSLTRRHGWTISAYFRGMNSKLLMTVLNASLMFALKETVLLSLLKTKRAMGSNVFRLVRWTGFVFAASYVAQQLSEARMQVEQRRGGTVNR